MAEITRITERTAEAAVLELFNGADARAEAKAQVVAAETAWKRAKAQAFLESTGSVAERESLAMTDPDVEAARLEYIDAVREDHKARERKDACVMAVEFWRSREASNRAGVRATE